MAINRCQQAGFGVKSSGGGRNGGESEYESECRHNEAGQAIDGAAVELYYLDGMNRHSGLCQRL